MQEEIKFRKGLHNRTKLILEAAKLKYKEAYGFLANPKLTARHNAYNQIGIMPCWHFFTRPTNMAYQNLTAKTTKKTQP